jgi:ligand-binding sensor domain-containing protein
MTRLLLIFIFSATILAQDNWTNYNKSNSGLPVNSIHTIAFDSSNTKWIGTWGGGLVRFDDTSWTVFNTFNSPLPHNDVYSILVDKDNVIWIGTFGGGLVKLDGDEWTIFNRTNSGLTDNTIYSMVFDENQDIYISTWGRAYLKFDRKNSWISYNRKGMPFYNKKVPSLLYERKSKLWIGAVNGLYLFDNGNLINFGGWDHNFAQSVYSITRGKDSTLWVGFKTGGIAKYENDKWSFVDYLDSHLPSNTVYHLNIDKDNNLWISTFGTGLAKLSGNEWTIYNKSNSPLSDDFVFSTAQDKEGDIWICTLNKGLFVLR